MGQEKRQMGTAPVVERATRSESESKTFHLDSDLIAYGVLGLSMLTLGISIYGISGGHLERHVHAQHASKIAYAAEIPDSDVQAEADSSDLSEEQQEIVEAIVSRLSQADFSAESVEDDVRDEVSDANGDGESTEDAELTDEELDAKAESMRLRRKPDRDMGDTYYYVVEKGDTLADLADHFDVTLGQLMEDNFIEDGDHIYVGEVIYMPTGYQIH